MHPVRLFLLKKVSKHPTDIVLFTAKHFNLTPQAIHKHLSALIEEGTIRKEGRTRAVTYLASPQSTLAMHSVKRFVLSTAKAIDEQVIWDEHIRTNFSNTPENIRRIAEYGFTEMLNNAKDHSGARQVAVELKEDKEKFQFGVSDNGIGIFRKIKDVFQLHDLREAILELSKGRVTTDKEHHSGEGIFFTSRLSDRFVILSDRLSYVRYGEDDWFVEKHSVPGGTSILFEISKTSRKTLKEMFNKYTSEEGHYFSKTNIAVELGLNPDETYISRAQAKRILSGLEKFEEVTLDFRRVTTVGQGFVDEVFRVFQNKYPNIKIIYINANEDVEFMIKRGLTR